MERKNIIKYTLIMLLAAIIGVLIGIPTNTCVHEFGHFLPAYIFDKSQINQTRCFIPENFFSTKSIMNLVPTGEVTFNKPVFEAFPFYQALIVTLAGPIFQLLLFILFLVVLDRILKKPSKEAKYYFKTAFLFGLIFDSSQLNVSWIHDINIIILQYTNNMAWVTLAILGIYYVTTVLYYYIIVSFVLRFGFILLPSTEKRFKSSKLFRIVFGKTT